MSSAHWVLPALAFGVAVSGYLALERLTGGDPGLFHPRPVHSAPKAFVPPPVPRVAYPAVPEPPAVAPAPMKAGAVPDDWTRLPQK